MDKTIKPCPFCGKAPRDAFENLMDDDDDGVSRVFTIFHQCPATGDEIWTHDDTQQGARDRWNTRPRPATDRYREALEVSFQDISRAIFDPGSEVGMRHDRPIHIWQADAVMNVLDRARAAAKDKP